MSDFDDASLVLIPSGYKNGKVYSVKPTDGTGDLTFTRASSATRVQSDGLIEKVRTNLVLRSEEFDNASWNKVATTVTANAEISPDGTQDAETMTVSISDSRVDQTMSLGAGTYTFSVYVKIISQTTAGSMRLQGFVDAANVSVNFTPTTEWQRFTATYTAAATLTSVRVRGQSFVGTLAVWGAQLEVSDFGATDYIPTTTAAVSVGPVSGLPRLDYLNSTCGKLILEPQRTNSVLFSEQLNAANWSASTTTVTANAEISPDGYQNADVLAMSASQSRVSQVLSLGAGTYSVSVYAKAISGSGTARILAIIDGVSTDFNFTPTTSWARYSFTFTAATSVTAVQLRAQTFIGNLSFWGCQLELGAYATSYIRTLGASVTRVVDAASKTGISSLIGQTEGTVFLEVDYSTLSGLNMFLSIRPNASNKVEVYRDGAIIYGEIQASTSFGISASKAVGTHKIAFAYKSGSSALYIDGTLAGQSTTAFTFSATLADLFLNQRNANLFVEAANYKQALLFKTRLTNAQLAELTAL
jgi:hypothetical protein